MLEHRDSRDLIATHATHGCMARQSSRSGEGGLVISQHDIGIQLPANGMCTGDDGMNYATLNAQPYFVAAQKLIAEGNRTYMNNVEGKPLTLLGDDAEGQLIQRLGVKAVIYSSELWYDTEALIALLKESNMATPRSPSRAVRQQNVESLQNRLREMESRSIIPRSP